MKDFFPSRCPRTPHWPADTQKLFKVLWLKTKVQALGGQKGIYLNKTETRKQTTLQGVKMRMLVQRRTQADGRSDVNDRHEADERNG